MNTNGEVVEPEFCTHPTGENTDTLLPAGTPLPPPGNLISNVQPSRIVTEDLWMLRDVGKFPFPLSRVPVKLKNAGTQGGEAPLPGVATDPAAQLASTGNSPHNRNIFTFFIIIFPWLVLRYG